jgi:hypothetical protein
MSESEGKNEPYTQRRTKDINVESKVVPTQFPTVHVDKAMVAFDKYSHTITITLLVMHPLPQYQESEREWTLSDMQWEVVGELKMSKQTMDALGSYYFDQRSNGLNVLPIVFNYLKEHPYDTKVGMSYGPISFKKDS